jgi:hypothetical protein
MIAPELEDVLPANTPDKLQYSGNLFYVVTRFAARRDKAVSYGRREKLGEKTPLQVQGRRKGNKL